MATNMDNKANPNATSDVLEFTLPKSEVDQVLDMDSFGDLCIPVQVVGQTLDTYTFRKIKSASVDKAFRAESVEQMRERVIEATKDKAENENEDTTSDSED
jgi:hypothetical protein